MSKKGFLSSNNNDFQPNAFAFTSVNNANVSTLYTSDVVQITGIRGRCPISLTGTGSPQYRISTTPDMSNIVQDWTGVSGVIKRNQYLQIRFSSPSNYSTGRTVNITIGTVTSSFTIVTKPQPAVKHVLLSSIVATQYTLEADWNPSNNSVQCIGGGAHGGLNGGGGGAWVIKNNVNLLPGQTVAFQVGNPNGNTDTWFGNTALVLAKGGVGELGGQASASVGDLKFSGGNGAYGSGGAAGSPSGNGNHGSAAKGGNAAGTNQGVGGNAGASGAYGTNVCQSYTYRTVPGTNGAVGFPGGPGTSGSQMFPSGGGGGKGGPGGQGGPALSCSERRCFSGGYNGFGYNYNVFCNNYNWTQPGGWPGPGGAGGNGGMMGGGGGAMGPGYPTYGIQGTGAPGGIYLTWQPI